MSALTCNYLILLPGIAMCNYLKSLASVLMSHKVCQLCTHMYIYMPSDFVQDMFSFFRFVFLLLLFLLLSALLSGDWMKKEQ